MEGADWTQSVADAVRARGNLQSLTPTDAADFCPNFRALDAEGRRAFWTQVLSNIAEAESGGDPARTHWSIYDRAMHRPTFRRGLFQISIEAAHDRRFQCEATSSASLTSPDLNAACAAKIMEYEVSSGGAIASAASYWPSLAHERKRSQIAAALSASALCAPVAETAP
jgi:hypothetical protein